jgi:hypothetical protein
MFYWRFLSKLGVLYILVSRYVSSLCLRRIGRKFAGNLKADISAMSITKSSRCSFRLEEFYFCVSQAEWQEGDMGTVLGNLKLIIGRLESQATEYKVVINRLKLILKIQNTDLCSQLRINWCGFYLFHLSLVCAICIQTAKACIRLFHSATHVQRYVIFAFLISMTHQLWK